MRSIKRRTFLLPLLLLVAFGCKESAPPELSEFTPPVTSNPSSSSGDPSSTSDADSVAKAEPLFSVAMPGGVAEESVETFGSGRERAVMHRYGATAGSREYAIFYFEFPEEDLESLGYAESYARANRLLVEKTGVEVAEKSVFRWGDIPGRRFLGSRGKGMAAEWRLFLKDERVFAVLAVVPEVEARSAEVAYYFSSLELTNQSE